MKSANLKAMPRAWSLVGAVTAALALAACGGGSITASHQPPATATTPVAAGTTTTATVTVTQPAPATTTTTTPASGPGACTAADLEPSFIAQNGATGHVVLEFALRNRGTSACHTYGYPGVQFLDRSGAALTTIPTHTTDDLLGSTPAAPITLAPGQKASFRLVTTDDSAVSRPCGTAYFLGVIAPDDTATMKVAIPGGASECAKTTVSPLLAGSDAAPGV